MLKTHRCDAVGIGLILVPLIGLRPGFAQEFTGSLQPAGVRPAAAESSPAKNESAAREMPPLDFNELRRGMANDSPGGLRPQDDPQRLDADSRWSFGESSTGQTPDLWPRSADTTRGDVEQTTVVQRDQATAADPRRTARNLIESYSIALMPDPLPGQPLLLADAIRETAPTQRRAMVIRYWQTHTSLALSLAAQKKRSLLQNSIRPQTVVDQSLWQLAVRQAGADAERAAIELARRQASLQSLLMASSHSDVLPLPADVPLVRGYETHFDWYEHQLVQGRAEMRAIDRSLPKLQVLIEQRAEIVQLAEQAWQQAAQAYGNGQTSMATVLYAVDAWQQATADFLKAVGEYNEAIADYSLTVTSGNLPAEQVASMLIGPTAPSGTRMDGSRFPIRQASLLEESDRPTTSVLERSPAAERFVPPSQNPAAFGGEINDSPRIFTPPSAFRNPNGG